MGSQKLKGKDLRSVGFRDNQRMSLAINIVSKHFKHLCKTEQLELLKDLAAFPEKYADHEFLNLLVPKKEKLEKGKVSSYELNETTKKYSIYGKKFIDRNTLNQMDTAMRLPVVEKGTLMPDAHVGYGIPIGGVIATKNEVVPYAVGLDIGCRMALTVFDAPAEYVDRYRFQLKRALKEQTHFGNQRIREKAANHEVLDREEFRETELLRQLHGKAWKQLGTSGSGNHFVEFGEVVIDEGNQWDIPKGNYLGLLSHSGSRGLGATIAGYYTKVATDVCRLPRGARQLAWLDLDTEEGMEYWLAMNLAGDYAKACHDVIHKTIGKDIGLKPLFKVENHHNFAWKEKQEDGKDLIVHRKGATPAGKGQLGIIPASMVHPGFVVSGSGIADALNSASHGSGRKMSRGKAASTFTMSTIRKELKAHRVTLIGGGTDEAPGSYKNIAQVMEAQQDLVTVEATFYPRIVRMDKD